MKSFAKLLFLFSLPLLFATNALGMSDTPTEDGSSENPYGLVIDGDKRNNHYPNKYYYFASLLAQNITVHITEHGDTTSGWFGTNRDLTISLHSRNDDGTCNTTALQTAISTDGNFDWSVNTTANEYCVKTDGNGRYDISLTGDADLKAGINDASANEADGSISFIVALTKAKGSDVTINYTFTDNTALNGTNYTGNSSTVTIAQGELSTVIPVPVIDTNMSTTKDFTITITSSDVTISDESKSATGTIFGSDSVVIDDGYEGPDICYDERDTSGFCMFGSCMFYKETTSVKSMVSGLDNINVKKSLTRGMAFLDFGSKIGIDGHSKTPQSGDDQAEKKSFQNNDFNGHYSASMFPKGIEYRLGDGANATDGGSLAKGVSTSYYDQSLFKFGLFTQYSTLVTYEKDGTSYQEVLQSCNPDTHGNLNISKPNLEGCGVFMDSLNSNTKIKFTGARGVVNFNGDTDLNTPEIENSVGTLCENQVCTANTIGSSQLILPASFLSSQETKNLSIPYSMVIAEQQIGSLVVNTNQDTENSETTRTIVFEAPYSVSYKGRVMLINSIQDTDAHADSYNYVFNEGDYWIGSWNIDKAKSVTIETHGNVRFFIKNDFKLTVTGGSLNIKGTTDNPFYMYLYRDFKLNENKTIYTTAATAIQYGYIYSKGSIDIISSSLALQYGSFTADGLLSINAGSSSFQSRIDNTVDNVSLFTECPAVGGGIYITGPFDAWDTFVDNSSVPPIASDRNITTKIVNTAFKLSLASLNKDSDGYETKSGVGSSIDVAIYPKNSNTAISNHIQFDANIDDHVASSANITVTSANADAVVGFKLCATYEHNDTSSKVIYVLHPIGECSAQTLLNDCDATTTGLPTWHICHATDDFAIRPYAFRVFGGDSYSRAGEAFTIDIRAVDLANYNKNSGVQSTVIGTANYNVALSNIILTSNFYSPTDSELDIMYKNVMENSTATASPTEERARVATCSASGIFTKINAADTFLDGNITANLKFSETGILTIDINETLGQEFAIIDSDDTSISQRLILGSTTINSKSDISKTSLLLVNPYSIDTIAEYNTSTSKAWLYMDDISSAATSFTKPNMSAYIHYVVTARNKDGNITKNFTSTCFPDVTESWPTPLATDCPRVNGLKLNTTYDFKLAATINTTASVNLSIFNGDVNENALYIDPSDQDAPLVIGNNNVRKATMYPKQFTDGTAESYVHFNVDRNTSTAQNPVKITVVDANTWLSWASSASPAAFNGTTLNKSYNYIYGRTNAPRQRFTTNVGETLIYYEAYCSDTDSSGNSCDKTLLPNSTDSNTTDDPRWFKNTFHTSATDGTVGTLANIKQKNSLSKVTATNLSSGNPEKVTLNYNGTSYPYKTTMSNKADKWLLYNRYDNSASVNEFNVEFISPNSNWAGVHETNATTETNATNRTNRRTMW